MRRIVGLAVVLGVLAWGQVAQAAPILWTLNGWTYDDGGTATGSFIYDVTTDTFSSINIVTTAGSVRSGDVYGVAQAAFSGVALLNTVGSLPLLINKPIAQFSFAGGLGTPGTVQIFPPGGFSPSWEGSCLAGCAGAMFPSPVFRQAIAGEAIGVLVAPVPEPTTLLLLGTGLAAMGYRRRRKQ